MKKNIVTALLLGMFMVPYVANGDDKGLVDPESSLVTESYGKITVLRAQPQGIEYGDSKDRLDAEVIFKLDKEPGKTFGIRYHEGVDPSIQFMAGLIREAFLNQLPITVLHNEVKGMRNKNIQVIYVEVTQ